MNKNPGYSGKKKLFPGFFIVYIPYLYYETMRVYGMI